MASLKASAYDGYLSLECLVIDDRYDPEALKRLGGPKGVASHDLAVLRKWMV